MVKRCTFLACGVALAFAAALSSRQEVPPLPGYDAELARMEDTIRMLSAGTSATTPHRLLRLAHATFGKASLTADYKDFRAAEDAIANAEKAGEPSMECTYLWASFEFKMHRLAAAGGSLERLSDLADVPEIAVLRADLLLQQGNVSAAEALYGKLAETECSWDITARIAWLRSRQGKTQEADRLYAAAQDELTAKELRHWAWLEMQRGLLELDVGHAAKGLARFEKADGAFPGYWLIEEHIAEAYGQLGRTAEAADVYRRIIRRAPHPELISSLACIEQRSDPAAAAVNFEHARSLFSRQRELYPEAAAGHLLIHLLNLPGKPDPELLSLADENLRLRPNPESMLLKARVLLRLNDPAAAHDLLDAAHDAGWATADFRQMHNSIH